MRAILPRRALGRRRDAALALPSTADHARAASRRPRAHLRPAPRDPPRATSSPNTRARTPRRHVPTLARPLPSTERLYARPHPLRASPHRASTAKRRTRGSGTRETRSACPPHASNLSNAQTSRLSLNTAFAFSEFNHTFMNSYLFIQLDATINPGLRNSCIKKLH